MTRSRRLPSSVSSQRLADAEWLALAGSLAGYHGLTRDAYTLDLRQFAG